MFIAVCIINIVLYGVYFGYAVSNGTKIFINFDVSDAMLAINKFILIVSLFIVLTQNLTTREINIFVVQGFFTVLFYFWLYYTKYV